jgi:membrane protein
VQSVLQQVGVEETVDNLIRTRGVAGIIGIVSLLWASLQIFVNSVPAMNTAFEVRETRGWLKLRLIAFGMMLVAGVLFVVSLSLSAGVQLAQEWGVPGLAGGVPWFADVLLLLAALAVSSTMYAIVYRVLPNVDITWRQAFIGGFLAALLWEVAKRGFAFYLANWGSYDKVYGALGGMIVLVLWTYYSAMVSLLGAEAASLARDVEVSRAGSPEELLRPAPVRRERARG